MIAPGAALATMSITPAGACWRRLVVSSAAEYSKPNSNSSSTTPISAPIEMNSSLASSGIKPPSPTSRPASR